MLALVTRADLHGDLATDVAVATLKVNGRITLAGIVVTAFVLIAASAYGAQLGFTTFAAGALVYLVVMLRDRTAGIAVARSVSWTVLLLVAGLFVLVQGMEVIGLLPWTRHELAAIAHLPVWLAVLGVGGITGLASNAINNLPAGLIAGSTIAGLPGHPALRAATAIGIDLGPNLSVTGSLATVLWLIALRREKIAMSGWSFLCVGIFVMPPALIAALECLMLTAR